MVYNKAFGQAILSDDGVKELAIQYAGQDKLFTYIKRRDGVSRWSNRYIKESYVSRTPEDLGGILIVNETAARIAATYRGRGSNSYAYYVDLHLKLCDPYKNIIIGEQIFVSAKTPPAVIKSHTTVYLYPEGVENWVERVWENYIRNIRNTNSKSL